jgi:protein-disulfide isomerase
LGAEQEIIANHVLTGQVRLVYWPMLDLGPNSENAAAAAFCAGEQDPAQFWAYHHALFENQGSVYLARRGFFVELAAELGLDGPTFESCYDGDAVRALLEELDTARREAGVSQRPTFDVNGLRLAGAQPYETFAGVIAEQLAAE